MGQEGREQERLRKRSQLKKRNHCWKTGDRASRSPVPSAKPWAVTVFNTVLFLQMSPQVIKHHIL